MNGIKNPPRLKKSGQGEPTNPLHNNRISENCQGLFEVGGKEYPITDFVQATVKETGEKLFIPVVDIPMMSDYKWQLLALNDRLNHPEKYESTENVKETVINLYKWLREHKPE